MKFKGESYSFSLFFHEKYIKMLIIKTAFSPRRKYLATFRMANISECL